MKNIFYVSNVQSLLFPQNTRSKFENYIDFQDLNYINEENIEIGIKSISFDNNQNFKLTPDESNPHMILIERGEYMREFNFYKNRYREKPFEYLDSYKSMNFNGNGEIHTIYVKSYIRMMEWFLNPFPSYSMKIIYFPTVCFYLIYFHEKEFITNIEFKTYIESTFKKISEMICKISASASSHEGEDFMTEKNEIKSTLYDIHIRKDVSLCIGYSTLISHSSITDMCNPGELSNFNEIKDIPAESIVVLFTQCCNYSYFPIWKNDRALKIKPNFYMNRLYGIRSNISLPSIRNGEYDKIINLFDDKGEEGVINTHFKNPVFFKTRKELLINCSFEIIDITSNETPNLAYGTPTYIQVVARKSEMDKHFNIFLDSTCKKSKHLYPANTSTDFTIELPQRLKFNRHWQISLKTLFVPNRIHIKDCYLEYATFTMKRNVLSSEKITIDGYYASLNSLIDDINKKSEKLPFIFEIMGEKIKISSTNEKINEDEPTHIHLSSYLSYILGFNAEVREKGQFLRLDENLEYIAPYNADIFRIYPKNIIVGCDIVDNTIFGGQHLKLLRLVPNNTHPSSDLISFDFHQDEYVDLGVREFKSIRISIMDVTGQVLKSDGATRLQLKFTSKLSL